MNKNQLSFRPNLAPLSSSRAWRKSQKALSLAIALGLTGSAVAATYEWSGRNVGDLSWRKKGSVGTNWNPNNNTFPDGDDEARFTTSVSSTSFILLRQDISIEDVYFSDNNGYNIDSPAVVSDNELIVGGQIHVVNGAVKLYNSVRVDADGVWKVEDVRAIATERSLGELHLHGQLLGDSGTRLTLQVEEDNPVFGDIADGGVVKLHNSTGSYEGTIVNKLADFSAHPNSLANATYIHHGGSLGLVTGTGVSPMRFGGLQYSGTLPSIDVLIGDRGLDITNTNDLTNPRSVGAVGFLQGLTIDGELRVDVSGTTADYFSVFKTLDMTNASIVNYGDSVAPYSEIVISRVDTKTFIGAFDESGLTGDHSLRYEAHTGQIYLVGPSPDVVYVNAAATGEGTGYSWENACTTLQDALVVAQSLSGNAGFTGEIWVAKGTYYPDEGGTATNNDRESTFEMLDGVNVYGGFDGTETARSERDFHNNITVLSGDIDGNDTTDSDGVTLSANDIVANNANTIVAITFETCVLDGFTITGGRANGATSSAGGGRLGRAGAVMINTDTTNTPTISNCRLVGNLAFQGGATFVHSYGSANFISCDFRGNHGIRGGAGYFWRSQVTTHNCNFSGNLAVDDGGAIYDDVLESGSTDYLNCTFTGNQALDHSGAIALSVTLPNNANTQQIRNTLVWNNLSNAPNTVSDSIPSYANFVFTNSSIEHVDLSSTGTNNFDGTDSANAPDFIADVDPSSAPTSSGNPILAKSSPGTNSGDSSLISSLPLDVAGRPREMGAAVDIGAYETDLVAPVITLLGDGIIFLEVDDTATFVDPGVSAVDNVDGDISANVSVIGSIDMGVVGSFFLTYIVSDAAGNANAFGRSVILNDTTKPIITAPADIVNVEITSPSGVPVANVNLGTPVMTDNASADPTPSNNAPSAYQLGVTQVSWIAKDASQNESAPDIQTVTVVDTTAPSFDDSTDGSTLPGITIAYTGTGSGGKTPYTFAADPNVTDLGDSSPAILFTPPSVDGYDLGLNTVTWRATDSEGNFKEVTQTVTVTDTVLPVFTNATGGQLPVVEVNEPNLAPPIAYILSNPAVTDNGPGIVVLMADKPTPEEYPAGDTTVTWTATDGSGNQAVVTQIVRVTADETDPVFTDAVAGVLPVVNVTPSSSGALTAYALASPSVTDNAPGMVTVGDDKPSPEEYPLGDTTVTWTATDVSGNQSSATQIVRVADITAPTLVLGNVTTSPSSASTIVFSATFSEPVTGFDASDIAPVTSNSLVYSGFTVTGSGANYTITMNGVTGDIYFRVEVPAGGGITDAAGNTFANSANVTMQAVLAGPLYLWDSSVANDNFYTGANWDIGTAPSSFHHDVRVQNGGSFLLEGDGSQVLELGGLMTGNQFGNGSATIRDIDKLALIQDLDVAELNEDLGATTDVDGHLEGHVIVEGINTVVLYNDLEIVSPASDVPLDTAVGSARFAQIGTLTLQDRLTIGSNELEFGGSNSGHVTSQTASVEFENIQNLTIGGNPRVGGSYFSDADVTFDMSLDFSNITNATITDDEFSVSVFESFSSNVNAQSAVSMTNVDLFLDLDDWFLHDVDISTSSGYIVQSTVQLDITDSSIRGNDAIDIRIGKFNSSSSESLNSVTTTVNLSNTSIYDVDRWSIGSPNVPTFAGSYSTNVQMDATHVDSLRLFHQAGAVTTMKIAGETRATSANVQNGTMGIYSAFDVSGDVELSGGGIVAEFDYAPSEAVHSYDLVTTGSLGELSDTSNDFSVEVKGLPSNMEVGYFGVVQEGGVDILRLIIWPKFETFEAEGDRIVKFYRSYNAGFNNLEYSYNLVDFFALDNAAAFTVVTALPSSNPFGTGAQLEEVTVEADPSVIPRLFFRKIEETP